jgi:hypothetical protein
MLTPQPSIATTSSTCLLPPAPASGARLRMSDAGRYDVNGTALPTSAVHEPAFIKGGDAPGVRAWSPPV